LGSNTTFAKPLSDDMALDIAWKHQLLTVTLSDGDWH
jgi:hypothetical protein